MQDAPNILILWTDQQRADALGIVNDAIDTPHLDQLAKYSTFFSKAYCAQPVCTPSRASLMSGLWPQQHGNWKNNSILPQDVRCIPEHLNVDKQYTTGHIGKWHLGLELFAQHGFDLWEGSEDDYQQWFPAGFDQSIRSPYHHFLVEAGYMPDEWNWFNRFVCGQWPEQHAKPTWIANRATDFIRKNEGKPWILDVNCLEPHHPNSSCRNTQYDPNRVPLPLGALETPPSQAPANIHERSRIMAERGMDGKRYPDEASRRQAVANYYGLVSLVDTHYGRILECLHQTNQFENTLIIFASDHGEMLNQFGLWGKGVMYDAAVRVPLMIKLPHQQTARQYDHPVSLVDLLPTLLDYQGLEQPRAMTGRSLLPACRGEGLPAQDAFCIWELSGDSPILDGKISPGARVEAAVRWHQENPTPNPGKVSVRTIFTPDGWRYSYHSSGEQELYYLPDDQAERSNLAYEAAHDTRRQELHQRIRAWQRDTEDFLTLPEAI
jgi:arylsulfatase A-like enzyme